MCSKKVRLETYHAKANRKYLNAHHRNQGVFEDKTSNTTTYAVTSESEKGIQTPERPYRKGWNDLVDCLEEMGVSRRKIEEIERYTSKARNRDSFSELIVKAITDYNITKEEIEQTDDLSECVAPEVAASDNLLQSLYLERSKSHEIEAGICFSFVSKTDDEKTLLRITRKMGEYVLLHPDCWHYLWNNTRDNLNRLATHYSNHQLDYISDGMNEINREKERKRKEREKRIQLEKTFSERNVPHDIQIRLLHVIDRYATVEEKEAVAKKITFLIQNCSNRDAYMDLARIFEDVAEGDVER